MTLILGLKYLGGSLLASDRRTMIGDSIMRDGATKIERLTVDVGITVAGLTGACDDIIRAVKAFCAANQTTSFDGIASCVSDSTLDYFKKNREKLEDDDDDHGIAVMLIASADRIRKILEKGYMEEASPYDCDGTGKPYAEYILRKSYRSDMDEQQAKELAVYTISETSKVDPNVGGDMDVAVCRKEGGFSLIDQFEIEDIKSRLAPLSRTSVEEQIRVVSSIVDLRETINNLSDSCFGFKLFYPNEKAVFQIMKPCRNADEFTNNISALALLIDQLNVKGMKVTVDKEGSINSLEEFMKQRAGSCPSETTKAFRNVMTMRSKKFPVHMTDPMFVQVVIDITGKYPPDWTSLYSKTLSSFQSGLEKLSACLSLQAR